VNADVRTARRYLDLYNGYKRSYEVHKIEIRYSLLEIIILGTIEAIASY